MVAPEDSNNVKALVWEAARSMAIRDVAEPEAQPGEVVIEVHCAGICGSELSGYLGHNALRVPPLVMGHEFAGNVVAVGDGVAQSHPELTLGRAVTANPMTWCGECVYCKRGLNHLCVRRKLIGAHRPGAYAQRVSAPANVVVALPDGMPLRTAALAEPTGVALRIASVSGAQPGDSVLIVGAGPIGLLALQALHLRGVKSVFISDLDRERLAMGEALGGIPLHPQDTDVVQSVRAATDGLGAAATIDAVGAAVTRATCVAATASAGTLVLSGLHEETSAIPAAEIIRREIVLRGCFCYLPSDIVDAVALLHAGKIRLDPWIVEAPLGDGGPWFERLIGSPGAVSKVLLYP